VFVFVVSKYKFGLDPPSLYLLMAKNHSEKCDKKKPRKITRLKKYFKYLVFG